MIFLDKFKLRKPKTVNYGKFKANIVGQIDEYFRISIIEGIDEILSDTDVGVSIQTTVGDFKDTIDGYVFEECTNIGVDPNVVERQQKRINHLQDKLLDIRRQLSPEKPYKDSHCIYPLVKCPRCTGYINEYTRLGYCPKCGQAIDWGEGDKENV